jgi:hypothetical protein
MRKLVCISATILGVVALLAASDAPRKPAIAHEAHKTECTETAINAVSADVQAMPDGAAKAKAMQEMKMAEELMAKKNMQGCVTHLHKAMEAMEE